MLGLDELGPRICIIGRSNSGKSTLAAAIERKAGLPAIHLDQLVHMPGTDWQPRGESEFRQLHEQAIAGERWVIEGNYSRLYASRFARATGLIRLEISTALSLFRYFRRTVFETDRAGALEGGRDSLKWDMIRHLIFVIPRNREKNLKAFRSFIGPKIELNSPRRIDEAYAAWALKRSS